ncbi:MAG: hypothetical protein MH252_13925 [Thermosynechococcaceae cyanobacterium MS004]|jgi:hypothetical protein|nr:hypothetical protein [Thermosynechococcaceae cyanobacterium MS004]
MILKGTGWQLMGILLGWGFIGLLSLSLWALVRDALSTSRRMHQIPCPHCRFFTNSAALKCTVHPATAMSEEAIQCPDFSP